MTRPKVAIIILNWNGKEDTIECLESLKHITYPNYEILLVDNGSTDGSVECFRERYPGMEIIENGENLGFAEGNNVGIRRAMDEGVDYVLLLNNDTVVNPEFLTELIEVSENNSLIGIVGPKIYYYQSKQIIHFAGGRLNLWTGKPSHIGINEIDSRKHDTIKEVDFITGCAFLIKCKLINDVGALDKTFFCYLEEIDLCLRAKKTGAKMCFVPKSKVWHKISKTSEKHTGFFEYYDTRNRFYIIKNHATLAQKSCFCIWFFLIEFTYKTIIYTKNNEYEKFRSMLAGIKDGLSYLIWGIATC